MPNINFPSSPALNQTYSFNNRTWVWNGSGWKVVTPNMPTVGTLSDVVLTSPTNGQALTYDTATSKWINSTVASAGGVTSFNTRTGAVTLTSLDVTGALTFTPYNSTNPAGYTSNVGTVTSVSASAGAGISITGSPITTSGTLNVALANTAVTPGAYTSANITVDAQGRITSATSGSAGGVTSFNTRTGAVVLSFADVTGALAYTPYNATNPAGYTSNAGTVTSVSASAGAGILVSGVPFTTSGTIGIALDNTTVTPGAYTSANITVDAYGRITSATSGSAGGVTSFNTRTGAVTLSSLDVTNALGYTPGSSSGTVTSVTVNGTAGRITGGSTITTSGTATLDLATTAVTPGAYTSANITVDAYGRITSAASGSAGGVTSFNTRTGAVVLSFADVTGALAYTPYNSTNPAGYTSNVGTVTSVSASAGAGILVSGVPFTTSGTIGIALDNTSVTPGAYTSANITVDAQGRITSAASGSAGGVTSFNTRTGAVTLTGTDVTTALTYTPAHAATNSDITSLTGITGNISTATYIDFNTTTTGTPAAGRMTWDTANSTLQVGLDSQVNLQIGQEQLVRIHNNTGSTLTDGQVVYINGSSGNRPTVALAQANTGASADRTLGVVTESITNGSQGFVTISGSVNGLNTAAFADGDILYLSAAVAGAYTNVKPVAPNHSVVVGYVVRAHATVGQIFVSVSVGLDLNDLHNVLITSPTTGQTLTYNSTTGIWSNSTAASGGGGESISSFLLMGA